MHVNDRIKEFIRKELMHADSAASLADDESLLEQGILDSLALAQLLTFLEEEFQFVVRDEEVIPENFETIRAIASFVEQRFDQGRKRAFA